MTERRWLSIPEAARTMGIPERTLRRYVEDYATYITTRRSGRTYSVAEESLPILEFIRGRYMAGDSTEQVEQALQEQFPRTVTVADSGRGAGLALPQVLDRLTNELATLRQELEQARADSASALEEVKAVHRALEAAEERDKALQRWLEERLPVPEAKRLSLVARVKKLVFGDRAGY